MDGLGASRFPEHVIGIAGRPVTAEEKSYVRQAVFLLRFRMRFDDVPAALPTVADSRVDA